MLLPPGPEAAVDVKDLCHYRPINSSGNCESEILVPPLSDTA